MANIFPCTFLLENHIICSIEIDYKAYYSHDLLCLLSKLAHANAYQPLSPLMSRERDLIFLQ
jgi:hypothetical protein